MFSNSKNYNNSNGMKEAVVGAGLNTLGSGTKITGDISADSDIRLDGELDGNIKCSGKVILGPQGRIKGEIDCQNAVIEGTIEGVLRVAELLQVKDSARINGEIKTLKLMVQPGAIFNVKCQMSGQTIAPKVAVDIKLN